MLHSVPQGFDLCKRAYINNERKLRFGGTQTMLSQVDRMLFVENIEWNNVLIDVG